MARFEKKFGLNFPKDSHIADVHLNIWRHYAEYEELSDKLLPRHKHMQGAIETLFPENYILQQGGYEVKKRGYIWNDWMDRRCWSFTYRDYQTWWGPSASGKSTDAGLLSLCAWLSSPSDTTVIVCSTTKPMLEKRIWREIVKFYQMRQAQFPGKLVRSDTSIYFDPANPLSGIHGVAVKRGAIEDALGDMIGMHNEYVYLLIDEMQATHEAAGTAWDNLSSGMIDGGFIGLGNPSSKLDPLGAASMPSKGWSEATTDKQEWKTKKGYCLYFDGHDSPGVHNPIKYPFLLTQKQIDQMAHDPGPDSPRYWTMRRGFLPPDGIVWAVLTERAIQEFHVAESCDFISQPTRVAGIDPAYSSGGDKCIIYPADVGLIAEDHYAIRFLEPIRIALTAREGEMMLQTLRKDICEALAAIGVEMVNTGMDTTGNQWMLADSVEEEARSRGMLRVKFSDPASSDPLSVNDPKQGKELYTNFVTELWGRFGTYVTNDMIRNLGTTAMTQFTVRQLNFSTNDTRKVVIESKKILHGRLGYSPDEADAATVCVEVVRKRLGILPMNSKGSAGGSMKGDEIDKQFEVEMELYEEGDSFGDDGFHSVSQYGDNDFSDLGEMYV